MGKCTPGLAIIAMALARMYVFLLLLTALLLSSFLSAFLPGLPFSSPLHALFRDHYTVEVPLPQQSFQMIPPELREGKPLQVYPVLFNVGINEQQTIAERYASSHQMPPLLVYCLLDVPNVYKTKLAHWSFLRPSNYGAISYHTTMAPLHSGTHCN